MCTQPPPGPKRTFAIAEQTGCRRLIKTVHVLLQTLVGVFIVLATVFAVLFKADQHGAHFWSVHAWVGAGAIALYCLQYPLGARMAAFGDNKERPCTWICCQTSERARAGLYVYLVSSMSTACKATFYEYHRCVCHRACTYPWQTYWADRQALLSASVH